MKRLVLLLAPFIMMTALNGCSSPGYIVDSEEFDRAIHMVGVKYLQYRQPGHSLAEFSPNGFHRIFYTYSEFENEAYVIKNGDNYTKYYRDNQEGTFTSESAEQKDFWTITNFADAMLEPVKDKTFSDYHYHEDKQEYIVDYVVYYSQRHTAIHFENKKVASIRMTYDDGGEETTYAMINFTYATKEVVAPTLPGLIIK